MDFFCGLNLRREASLIFTYSHLFLCPALAGVWAMGVAFSLAFSSSSLLEGFGVAAFLVLVAEWLAAPSRLIYLSLRYAPSVLPHREAVVKARGQPVRPGARVSLCSKFHHLPAVCSRGRAWTERT